jgi:hypothetical protein
LTIAQFYDPGFFFPAIAATLDLPVAGTHRLLDVLITGAVSTIPTSARCHEDEARSDAIEFVRGGVSGDPGYLVLLVRALVRFFKQVDPRRLDSESLRCRDCLGSRI